MAALDETLGALEIGIMISILLFGIFIVQVFIYSQGAIKDGQWMKFIVTMVGVLETAHAFSICVLLYQSTVTHFGDEGALSNFTFAGALSIVLTSWVGALVQSFFAYRVKMLSGRLLIPVITWFLSFLRLCFGTLVGVTIPSAASLPVYVAKWSWLLITQLVVCAVTDVLNTGSLCLYLFRMRPSRSVSSSSKLVNKIIVVTIETGLVTSVTALVMLICVVTMPNNTIFLGILMFYPKLFSISFMTSLNARESLRQMPTHITSGGLSQRNNVSPRHDTITGLYVQPSPSSEGGAVGFELQKKIDAKVDDPILTQHHSRISQLQRGFEDTEFGKPPEL